MSKLWSTSLRDTLSNRRNISMPELQCRGYRTEDLYVTSLTASATTDKIPEKKTLRDYRDFDRPLIEGGVAWLGAISALRNEASPMHPFQKQAKTRQVGSVGSSYAWVAAR